jgi:hypothetical protein
MAVSSTITFLTLRIAARACLARGRAFFVTVALAAAAATALGCATAGPPGERPGQVYEIAVASIDGYPTANRGPAAYPACTIQVGSNVARVWLAHPDNLDAVSPVVLTGDAASLKEGILVERTWQEAVVHPVTDEELAAGAAVVYVPGFSRPHAVVELRFQPVGRWSSKGKNDLAEHGSGLKRAVARRDVR